MCLYDALEISRVLLQIIPALILTLVWPDLRASRVSQPSARPPDTSESAVVSAAAAYVEAYQERLTSVVADEAYTQRIVTQRPVDPSAPSSRKLESEIFFIFGPHERQWMAIRDVLRVDGAAVADRPDLNTALRTLPSLDVHRTFKTYNSRFNLGRVTRDFNEPTLGLLVLDRHHKPRFRFDRRSVQLTEGTPLVTLEFTEKERPTLVQNLAGRPVYARGRLLVEAGSGAIRHAVLTLEIDAVRIELITEYSQDDRLGMLVPRVFREIYQDGRPSGDSKKRALEPYEHVTCEATYSNYRRFETSARIK